MSCLSRRCLLRAALASVAIGLPDGVYGQSGAGEELVIAQCCDPQLGFKTSKIPGRQDYKGDLARLTLMVDKINGIKPDIVIWCGDMVQAASWDQSDMLGQLKRLEVPYRIAPGNHDIPEPMTQAGLDRYQRSYGKDFSFADVKGWKILALNSQRWRRVEKPEFRAEQDAFVEEQFRRAAKTKMPVLVATHIPPYKDQLDEDNAYSNIWKPFRKTWLDTCVDNNVKIYLAGHTHQMCRKEYRGMAILNGEVTCIPLDGRPTGFRVLRIKRDNSLRWDFVPVVLEQADPMSRDRLQADKPLKLSFSGGFPWIDAAF